MSLVPMAERLECASGPHLNPFATYLYLWFRAFFVIFYVQTSCQWNHVQIRLLLNPIRYLVDL